MSNNFDKWWEQVEMDIGDSGDREVVACLAWEACEKQYDCTTYKDLYWNVMEVHNTDEPEPRIEYVCPECGEADEVTVDADVKWDAATQEWVIEVVQPGNSCYCSWCGSGMNLDECKRAIPTYVVGWNMPGYMPDNTPEVCATLAEAKEYLAENITHYIEDLDHDTRYTEKQVEGFSNVLKEFDAAPPQECNVYIGDYVYFITQE